MCILDIIQTFDRVTYDRYIYFIHILHMIHIIIYDTYISTYYKINVGDWSIPKK